MINVVVETLFLINQRLKYLRSTMTKTKGMSHAFCAHEIQMHYPLLQAGIR